MNNDISIGDKSVVNGDMDVDVANDVDDDTKRRKRTNNEVTSSSNETKKMRAQN